MAREAIVSAARAIDVAQRRHDLVAENVANVSTPGFKRRVAAIKPFDDVLARKLGRIPDRVGGEVAYDFSPGELRHTGAGLDLAIDGPGFFAIQSASGVRYTRNGAFAINGSGELVTKTGALVLSAAGPIRVTFPGPEPTVSETGDVLQGGALLGTLRVVDFPDRSALRAEGGNFRAGPGAVEIRVPTAVRQGYIESSNVNSVEELVELILNMRTLEASQKALSLRAQLLEKVTNRSQG